MNNKVQHLESGVAVSGAFVDAITIVWASFGLLLLLLNSAAEWPATAGVLMLSQAFTGRMAWKRFKIIKNAIFPDFLTLVLIYQFGTKFLTMSGLILRSISDELGSVSQNLKLAESVPVNYQYQAELVFLLATVVFTSVWRFQERKGIRAVWQEPPTRVAWLAYFISLFCYFGLTVIVTRVVPGMALEFIRLFALGALAALLGGNSVYALGKRRSWMPIAALGPFLILALISGMKAEVALIFFPIIIPVVRKMTLARFGFTIAFLVFTLLFIFPFSETWRDENWRATGAARQQASVSEVTVKVIDTWKTNGIIEVANNSTSRWLARGSTSEIGGLVMLLAERDGFIGPILIEGLVTIFVPRFIWPDKPTYAPGAWFTWYLGNALSPETATSATAMMMPTELYWMFGVAGVVIGMGLIAVLYFSVWNFLIKKSKYNIIATLALFALLARSAGLEEIHAIYAISSPVTLIVYFYIFSIIVKIMTLSAR